MTQPTTVSGPLARLQRAADEFEAEERRLAGDPASLALLYVDAWTEPYTTPDVARLAVDLGAEAARDAAVQRKADASRRVNSRDPHIGPKAIIEQWNKTSGTDTDRAATVIERLGMRAPQETLTKRIRRYRKTPPKGCPTPA